ncbi:MAG: hypothetical protein B6D44_00765 [Ignavibacteriales bacterium UTCHB2]|jgi:hypothetical protein|nr:MAG: hypothetical protein B6D44_00765 [Ignavibacteriales bacterium UTCHB2]
MSQQIDDLDAVRQLVTILEKFDKTDQERIIKWAREKLGLSLQPTVSIATPQNQLQANFQLPDYRTKDLKSFVNEKSPSSDMQFAVTVAYYYKFEAPEKEKKDSINSEILQDAARLSGRKRLGNPGQTLINASFNGMLDKSDEKGAYKINTVGENLVAMTLPHNAGSKTIKKKLKTNKKKTSKKSSDKK